MFADVLLTRVRDLLEPHARTAGFVLVEEALDRELAWLLYRRPGPAGRELLELFCRRDRATLVADWWRPAVAEHATVIRTHRWPADADPSVLAPAVVGVIAAWLAEAGA